MSRKYVENWYLLIPIYLSIIKSALIRFRTGKKMIVSKKQYEEFRDELFQQYLTDRGFSFTFEEENKMVITDTNLKLYILKDYTNVIDEIFIRNIYGEGNFKDKTIIDIGASIGDTPIYFISKGAKRVYGFESDLHRYNLAVKNVEINNMAHKITMFNNEANSKSVESLINEHSMENIYLKIDCEGCEFELIKNLPDDIYAKIDFIIMEFHSEPSIIIQRLNKLGFKVKKFKKPMIPEGFVLAERKS